MSRRSVPARPPWGCGAPDGIKPGNKLSASAPNSEQLEPALDNRIPSGTPGSFRLGAGRSQVQILSPRLKAPANGIVCRVVHDSREVQSTPRGPMSAIGRETVLGAVASFRAIVRTRSTRAQACTSNRGPTLEAAADPHAGGRLLLPGPGVGRRGFLRDARSSCLAGVCRDGARTTASRGGSASAPAAPACRFDHAIACRMSSCPRLA